MSLPPLPGRSRWWLLPAFFLLLSVSPQVAVPVLGAGVVLRAVVGIARRQRARRAERHSVRSVLAAGGLALGVDPAGRLSVLADPELGAHGLILGASGAGKSTTLLRILTERIRTGRAVVAIDLKGSPAFAAALRATALECGRPFRCWTPDGPERWNPLARGNATELKDKLIATEQFTEPHYRRAAERYVQLALQVLQESDPRQPVTLSRVVDLLEPRRLAAEGARLAPGRAERLRAYVAALTPDQVSAVRGLASRLAILTESHTGPFLEGSGVDLGRALAGEEIVLFSLNSSSYGGLAAQLGTLAVQDLVAAAGQRLGEGAATTARAAATVAVDEFSALGSDNLMALLARGREAGVSVLLATQELADLDRAARGLREQVLGNTAVKIAHRQDVPESAAAVARLAGTERVWEPTYQLGGAGRLVSPGIRGTTLRLAERPAVDAERIRTLSPGEALVIVKTPRSRSEITRVLPPSSSARTPGGRGPSGATPPSGGGRGERAQLDPGITR
jgi:hypothetical protein